MKSRRANSSDIQVTRGWKWTKTGVSKKAARQVPLYVPFANPTAVTELGPAMYRSFIQTAFRYGYKTFYSPAL